MRQYVARPEQECKSLLIEGTYLQIFLYFDSGIVDLIWGKRLTLA